eukprot:1796506-Rhodomonas_salina.1
MLLSGKSVILLSMYVDYGIVATNDAKFYQSFLADLDKDFELSDQGLMTWYLGVAIHQGPKNRSTKLLQKQYMKDILERFGMTGAAPVNTPMEPNSHLRRSDCPPLHKIDKKFLREYQQLVGGSDVPQGAHSSRPGPFSESVLK